VRPGQDGLHFPVGDAAALADLLIRAAADPDLWDSLQRTMRVPVSIARSTDAHLELYRRAAAVREIKRPSAAGRRRRPALFLSGPALAPDYAGCVLPWRERRPFQSLFGFDTQLNIFAKLAANAGYSVYFLPAPEIFSSPVAFRHLEKLAGVGAQAAPHIRFGPVSLMRVLKGGARNVAAIAEPGTPPPLNLGRHPFGTGEYLPHAFRLAFTYRKPVELVTF